jgi:dolichyl-phosphooligosaccharide-protein glycotransferase
MDAHPGPSASGRRHPSPATTDTLLVLGCFGIALFLRFWYQRPAVTVDGTILFTDDGWYHMRLVDALVRDFPHRIHYDVFARFGGAMVRTAPLLDLLVAGTALAVGGPAPAPGLVDLVGAWLPPILGAAVVVPIYALGRLLFGRPAALSAAAVAAVLPGAFLTHGSFGFTDHHVLGILFATLTLLGFCGAVREADRVDGHAATGEPHGRMRVAAWAAAGGVALGSYLLSWTSGVFLVAVLVLWLGLDFLRRAHRGAPLLPLAGIGATAFALAAVPVLPYVGTIAGMELVAQVLVAACAGCLITCALARPLGALQERWRAPTLLGGAAAFLLLLVAAFPTEVAGAIDALRRLHPTELGRTVIEGRSLLAGPAGAWSEYASAGPFALGGLGMCVARLRLGVRSEHLLVLVFAVVTLTATLVQVRFSYYFAITVALFAGLAFGLAAVRQRAWIILLGIALFLPTGIQALRLAHRESGVPVAWRGALSWLRANSPEPFGSDDAYYARFARPPEGEPFPYPSSAYSVLSWWDYGYLIQRLAHRIPVTNPAQALAREAAELLLARTPEEIVTGLRQWRVRYVMVDSEMTANLAAWKIPAIATWAGRPPQDLFEFCKLRQPDGALADVMVLYPAFYESLAVRLWAFGGRAVEPSESTFLIQSAPRTGADGTRHCEIVGMGRFATYDDAVRALPSYPGARIVGLSTTASPVPLAALEDFHAVYDSPEQSFVPWPPSKAPYTWTPQAPRVGPAVRIFEYVGDGS